MRRSVCEERCVFPGSKRVGIEFLASFQELNCASIKARLGIFGHQGYIATSARPISDLCRMRMRQFRRPPVRAAKLQSPILLYCTCSAACVQAVARQAELSRSSRPLFRIEMSAIHLGPCIGGRWVEGKAACQIPRERGTPHKQCQGIAPVNKKRRLVALTRSTAKAIVAATSVLPGTEQVSKLYFGRGPVKPFLHHIENLVVQSRCASTNSYCRSFHHVSQWQLLQEI